MLTGFRKPIFEKDSSINIDFSSVYTDEDVDLNKRYYP